jgi:probable rRNA maturation factor
LKVNKAIEAANEILRHEWSGGGELSITFDGDKCLRNLNREFLGKDEPTDVIAFNLSPNEDYLVGDIYISVERAAEQAKDNKVELEQELLRLELHGILHLVGYDHNGGDDEMWKKQEYWVLKLSGKAEK